MRVQTARVLALQATVFRRTLGVRFETYQAMRAVLVQREADKPRSGRPAVLDLDDQLVLSLSFWREYRTYHHLSLDWEVDERTVGRTVERVENALITSGTFRLPGRQALRDNVAFEVVVVDVVEHPMERPKKSNGATTAARKSATPRKLKSLSPSATCRF